MEKLEEIDRGHQRRGGPYKRKKRKSKMSGRPQLKGVVLKVSHFSKSGSMLWSRWITGVKCPLPRTQRCIAQFKNRTESRQSRGELSMFSTE